MQNEYRIIDYRYLGLPSVEVHGDRFHYQDLYELVGKNQFMTTFELKEGSESYDEYGDSVLGIIYYDRKGLDALEESCDSGIEVTETRVRIDSPRLELTNFKKRGDLKYKGINVHDIESISFLPYTREIERYETGQKKVPDVIEIKVDCSGIDADILNLNYLTRKHNSGTALIQYEKEQLVGITLAINQGRIDSRILNEFGFTEDHLKTNLYIWMNLYKVKERRKQLTESDQKNYSEIKTLLALEKFIKVAKGLVSAGIPSSLNDSERSILKNIFASVEVFSPSILMHGKKQVYWDLDSYIHIAFRHIKDYHIGNFSSKTPFPYKAKDLELLIGKVLSRIEEEITQYLSNPKGDFSRHGKMAVAYNGDHYHVRIDREGKLTQFHIVGGDI